jgi:hypothetical protein
MKKPAIFLLTISITPALAYGQAKVQDSVINQTGSHWFGINLLLVAAILTLLVLALWLLNSSIRLEHTVDDQETSGGNWLKNHLNELDINQLEILIKLKSPGNNVRLKNENSSKK